MKKENQELIQKLSMPIDVLGLDNRSSHMLKRGELYKISQIIIAGKSQILSLRNIGDLLADRIFNLMSNYLSVPKDKLFSPELVKLALIEEEQNPYSPLNISVSSLDLPKKILDLLKHMEIFTIKQLIDFRANNYGNDDRFGVAEVRKINRALMYYASRSRIEQPKQFEKPINLIETVLSSSEEISPLSIDLDFALQLLEINDRAWSAIHLRAQQLLTLEEIAEEIGGVTRERVRQIIELASEKIAGKFNLLINFLDLFNGHAQLLKHKFGTDRPAVSVLVRDFYEFLLKSNFVATEDAVEKVVSIIRLLAILDKQWFHESFNARLKELSLLTCLAEPVIGKNKRVLEVLALEKEKNRRVTYKEIAYMVLSKAKKPMHWSEIAEKAYSLNKKERFETRALYHVLLAHEDVFVRVGQGTYELAEWGGKQVKPYTEIIASVLQEEKRTLQVEYIFNKVSSIRVIKNQTLIMYLDMHPRFYKSINGTYGLRSWLPPREKQNLRTPDWLVEDSKSLERVDRAIQRGYDVESIVDEDFDK